MPQFAVHRNPNRATKATVPYLLDVQCDLLSELGTRVVVPLYPASTMRGRSIKYLTPTVKIDGKAYVLVVPQLAGVPVAALGPQIADLTAERDSIVAALDLLITGF